MKCKNYCLLEKPEGFCVIGGVWWAVEGHLEEEELRILLCTSAQAVKNWEWKGPARVNVFLRFLSYWYTEICRKLCFLFCGCFFHLFLE